MSFQDPTPEDLERFLNAPPISDEEYERRLAELQDDSTRPPRPSLRSRADYFLDALDEVDRALENL